MTDTWESLFKEYAVENNHTGNYLKECFEYAGSLHQRNLPVIFDFVHLAMYFECSTEYLKGVVAKAKDAQISSLLAVIDRLTTK